LNPDRRRGEAESGGDARMRRLLTELREFEPRIDNRALRTSSDRSEPRDLRFDAISMLFCWHASRTRFRLELVRRRRRRERINRHIDDHRGFVEQESPGEALQLPTRPALELSSVQIEQGAD
jgi:hypothetical protein